MGDARLHDAVRRHPRHILIEQSHGALAGMEQPADGLERGGLASAIGADERHDLTLAYLQVDTLKRVDLAVVGVNAAQAQNDLGRIRPRLLPPPIHGRRPQARADRSRGSRPQVRLDHAVESARTSAGVPSAIRSP